MEEFDLKADCKRNTNSYFYSDAATSLERYKNVVKSLLDDENIPQALFIYTRRAYSANFLKTECLEILVDGVADLARRYLKKSKKFSFDSFLCSRCSDIIRDPVTLKCGHTYSKKCMLLKLKNDSFTCPRCEKSYSFAYLSQLRNNVAILSLVEKLYERYLSKHQRTCGNIHDRAYGTTMYVKCKCDDAILCAVNSYATNMRHCKNFGDFKEAFKAYLTFFAIDTTCLFAKRGSIEVLRQVLQNNLFPLSQNSHPIGNSKHLKREKTFGHSENSLRNLGSNDSLHYAEDDMSSSDEEEVIVLTSEYAHLHSIFNSFLDSMKKASDKRSIRSRINKGACGLDKREFECPLCMRLLWEPVTTTCGHTFCRVCLNRSFDHQPTCPLCKTSLASFLAERVQNTTEFLELAIENLFPVEFSERRDIFLEEMEELTNAGKDPEHEIPLFVCTVALPTLPCPLHVFEPRYRLMIRQCMESGSQQFGMCGVVDDQIAEYGTMLEIRNVQYFPDGRSIVDTIGRKRFRILRRGERDGYHTGAVEFLKDQPLSALDRQCIEEKHDRAYKFSKILFRNLPVETRLQILQHFGPMPHVETNYASSPDGPSWFWWMLAILPVETKLKVLLISLTSLAQRLETLYKILLHFQSTIMS